MNTDKKAIMLAQPIKVLLVKFGVPSLIGMLANALHNTIDTYFVGTIGVPAVAAVGLVFPILMVGSAIGLVFGSGVASIISRDLGSTDGSQASGTLSTALIMALGIGTGVAAVSGVFARPMLSALGADSEVALIATRYLRLVLPGAVLGIGTMVLNNAIRAEGSPVFGMVVIICGAALNSILDAIFIGVLSLGVTGAAVATTIAQVCTFAALFARYAAGATTVKLSGRSVGADGHRSREVMATGLPALLFQGMTIASMAILNSIASSGGPDHVAGVTVAYRIITLAVFVQFGFAKGIQPVIGFNWGAKRYDRARDAALATGMVLVAFGALFALGIGLFGQRIVGLFVDGTAAAFAMTIIRYQSLLLPTGGIAVVLLIYYLAIGRKRETALLALLRQGALLIPLAYIARAIAGIDGLALAPAISDLVVSIVGIAILVRLRMMQPMPAVEATHA